MWLLGNSSETSVGGISFFIHVGRWIIFSHGQNCSAVIAKESFCCFDLQFFQKSQGFEFESQQILSRIATT